MLLRALKAQQTALADIGEPRPEKRRESKKPHKCPKKVESDWRLMVSNVNYFANGIEWQ